MNEVNQSNPTNEMSSPQDPVSPNTLNALFARLDSDHIEQFYQSYQSWILQQQRGVLLTQIATLQQKVVEHAEQMQEVAPSALALASLTQLQSCGVEDIDLLERMLERGEVWLDHTIQLLRRCEQLDVIGGSYTEWCEHALEGAYDWIASIGEDADESSVTLAKAEKSNMSTIDDISAQITEELILQKLMSDGEEISETEKMSAVEISRITQPLLTQDVISSDNDYTEPFPTIRLRQPSEELSLSAQPTGLIPVEYQQAGDAVAVSEELLEEIEQEELQEGVELEKIEEAKVEVEETMAVSEDLQEEVEQEDLQGNAEPEGIEEAKVEVEETMAVSEDLQEEVEQEDLQGNAEPEGIEEAKVEVEETMAVSEELQEEIEQDGLQEGVEPEGMEEAKIEARRTSDMNKEFLKKTEETSNDIDSMKLEEYLEEKKTENIEEIIDLDGSPQTNISTNYEIKPVGVTKSAQQVTEYQSIKEPEANLVDDVPHSIQDMVSSGEQPAEVEGYGVACAQEEEKPQLEIVLSERGFLQKLLARIWGR